MRSYNNICYLRTYQCNNIIFNTILL
jgi:hypothetical protein